MIWVTSAQGDIAYLCQGWYDLTGQPPDVARAGGWVEVVHPDDIPLVCSTVCDACAKCVEFWMVYRLRQRKGDYVWVLSGAAPSHSAATHEFLGFMGSTTPIELRQPIEAHGELGPFRPSPPPGVPTPKSHLDMIADLVVVARSVAEEGGDDTILDAVDDCLTIVRKRLAAARALAPN